MHPYFTQERSSFYAEHEVVMEAWSPIARGEVLGDAVLRIVVARSGGEASPRSCCGGTSNVGDIVFPKTMTPSGCAENFAIFDFELDDEAMAAITAVNRNERTGPDPDTFAYVP